MQFRSTEQKYLTAFSYASLTDVVLQLLIFFLLSSSMVIQSGIKVQLPRADAAPKETKSQIVLSVNAEGLFFLNTRPVQPEELSAGIRDLLRSNPEDVVVLQADKAVSLQRAVEAMD